MEINIKVKKWIAVSKYQMLLIWKHLELANNEI